MAIIKSHLKSAAQQFRSITTFPRHSRHSQSQSHPPNVSKTRRSITYEPAMISLFQSMTPPIHINNNQAPEYILSLLQNPFHQTLTPQHLSTFTNLEFYALSYRHQHRLQPKNISFNTLHTATEIIRSHAAQLGRTYYSIWIDILFIPTFAHPTITNAERGLLPYALFYVVAIASEKGFENDISRAWIRCEHQLAANSRGLLINTTQQPPRWTEDCYENIENGYRRIYGACLQPNCALYALASAISFGMLDAALVAQEDDLHDLVRWSVMLLLARWSVKYLYSFPDCCKDKDRGNRVRTMLNNTADLFVGWKKEWRIIVDEIPMIRAKGTRRPWDGAVELLHCLSRHVRLSEALGIDEQLHAEIRRKSTGFLITCTNGQEVGVYVCYWKSEGAPIAMVMDLVAEEDGSKSIVGYRAIHEYCVRMSLRRFDGTAMYAGRLVCRRDCCDFMEILTAGLLQVGYVVGDVMVVADCGNWFVGLM